MEKWYAEGLRFGCRSCGRCCGEAPGYVWLDDRELAEIAAFVGRPVAEFLQLYVQTLWRGKSLREKENYDCILLDGGRCLVYEVRPLQCRIWPFWPDNLRTPEAWQAAGRRCPGIGQGPLIAFEQIEGQRMEMAHE
jgi:hypothetical protein